MGRIDRWLRPRAGSSSAPTARFVVIATADRRRLFVPGPLARLVFGTVRDRHDTFAACLMPDHLQWVLRETRGTRKAVRELKRITERLAGIEGLDGRLWSRRGERHRLVRGAAAIERLASSVVEHPARTGLVLRSADWPYRVAAGERGRDQPSAGPLRL